MDQRPLLALLRAHVPADDHERAMTEATITMVAVSPDFHRRSRPEGHITGSAWIVDPSARRVLLCHHGKLGIWVQLGGHCEETDIDIATTALREAREESGLRQIALVTPAIFDLDIHAIPARRGEPAHDHHDIRFLFTANCADPLAANHESRELAWIAWEDVPAVTSEESVLRMLRKTWRRWG